VWDLSFSRRWRFWLCHFGLSRRVDLALKMETARFSETLAYTNQSTRRLNPKEHHQEKLLSFFSTATFQNFHNFCQIWKDFVSYNFDNVLSFWRRISVAPKMQTFDYAAIYVVNCEKTCGFCHYFNCERSFTQVRINTCFCGFARFYKWISISFSTELLFWVYRVFPQHKYAGKDANIVLFKVPEGLGDIKSHLGE
jgi:hypothetical protein